MATRRKAGRKTASRKSATKTTAQKKVKRAMHERSPARFVAASPEKRSQAANKRSRSDCRRLAKRARRSRRKSPNRHGLKLRAVASTGQIRLAHSTLALVVPASTPRQVEPECRKDRQGTTGADHACIETPGINVVTTKKLQREGSPKDPHRNRQQNRSHV